MFKASLLYVVSTIVGAVELSDIFGEVKRVENMEPSYRRSKLSQPRSESYFAHRTPENCDFPLEIYIVQDNTASFQDNHLEMKNTQIPLLVEAMNSQHPGTTYGIMSFRDKPIWSLGEPRSHDYCQRFESPLSLDDSLITAVYNRLISVGGADPSENQYGAIVAAAQSSTPGWSNPDATKLIVLATDAPPHFEGDGANNYGMTTFDGIFDEANAADQCITAYYPSPDQVKIALESRDAYLATIVFDGEWMSGLPSKSWAWFNSFLGQRDEFLEPLGNTSTEFFESLSKVIATVRDIECVPQTTNLPSTASTDLETMSTPMASTSPEVASTSVELTSTPTELVTTLSALTTISTKFSSLIQSSSTEESTLKYSTISTHPSAIMTTTSMDENDDSTTNGLTSNLEMLSSLTIPSTLTNSGNQCGSCSEEPCICNRGVVINVNVGFSPRQFEVENHGQGFSV